MKNQGAIVWAGSFLIAQNLFLISSRIVTESVDGKLVQNDSNAIECCARSGPKKPNNLIAFVDIPLCVGVHPDF